MLQDKSLVMVADNSGAKIARVFKVPGGSRRRYAGIGDTVVVSIQVAEPRKAVKKKDVYRAVVVRQKNPYLRKDGSYLRFDENAVVLVEKVGKEMGPKGNRVFGPVPRELSERGWHSIVSLAPEVV
ncbi:50S ribosomal protein L14 [Candidatus Kaiserbacteria bacterium RIFCSPLOWO2_02_FULL_56_11]|uniref:Large ribosomal subunit protein uL14 n=2 Tax=Candidatus Kaiseribacteriota TaxID=1752734 RepID=A0A1F6E1W6_9BACT|nr:MAG: 50S ribosomal protein L14 [Candidatus Kaiserbacteria bacterium RIFCSPHIGHO2_02_FULL_56_30]OGG72418.1 MAG: 50S ribosomal protein L14 [Candidatus Kaiserbacteria bacterium RIFCSPHIGHO2_12_FULL_56_13]OGG82285.1 MAG: 50S ribosomal protein L14 [Candidatus Kaiserbacteria bacterium RIFCSPLOWO2_02_FULL_56_11]